MTGSPAQLRQAYERALAYCREVEASGLMDGHVSEFWTDILAGRANYPSFEEMLSMRHGATYPMAERRDREDDDAELDYARAAWTVASSSVPAEFLDGLDEPSFGAPRLVDFDGRELSANCLVNAVTVHRVLEACRRAELVERPLRILEIGAGFGQAARLLLERLDVRTYAICDLPENLFLSAFYLQALFPERSASFGGGDSELAFVAPPHAGHLAGPFELVLNSYSFQEMSRASVAEYFALAQRVLAPDGIFYSLNSHGKDEIAWPSEYPLEGFRIERVASPRKFPFQLNATIPYELVLRPGARAADDTTGVDALGCAFQLGLDEELDALCERFAHGVLQPGEADWLAHVAGLFRAPDLDEKRRLARELDGARVLPHVSAYLAGSLAYAAGDLDEAARRLDGALAGLGPTLARVHALAMLGTVPSDDRRRVEANSVAAQLAPHLAAQVVELGRSYGGYAPHIRACLRFGPDPAPLLARLRQSVRRIGRSSVTR